NGNCILDTAKLNLKAKSEDGIVSLRTLMEQPIFREAPDGTKQRILSYKSLRELLNEFCNNIEPEYYKEDGSTTDKPIKSKNEEEIPDENTEFTFHHSAPLGFYSEEKDGVNIIRFYRQNPYNSEQKLVRNYVWRGNEKSIVLGFDISTQNDFAQMNSPITVMTKNGPVQVSLGVSSTAEDLSSNLPRVNIINELYESAQKNIVGATFTTGSGDANSNGDVVSSFISSFIENINSAVFSGTLTIPLDPYYLFDKSISPFMHKIKIIVNTTSYKNREGDIVFGKKSYLSGTYAIKKIIHDISYSGSTTKLEVMRFPEPKDKITNVTTSKSSSAAINSGSSTKTETKASQDKQAAVAGSNILITEKKLGYVETEIETKAVLEDYRKNYIERFDNLTSEMTYYEKVGLNEEYLTKFSEREDLVKHIVELNKKISIL
ncbi:MAG: hypothetical protein M0R03_20030, partial [Novosphingobium sp.]|nr:hypothetical protein [Novosphingobium sp.]